MKRKEKANLEHDLPSMSSFPDTILDRTIPIIGEINDETTAVEFYEQLQVYLSQEDESPITVLIDSPGGSLNASMAIVDMMEAAKSRVPIATVCISKAWSGGALIFVAGSCGLRYALPSAEFMFHDISLWGVGGDHQRTIEPWMSHMIKKRDMYKTYLARHIFKKEGLHGKQLYPKNGSLNSALKKVDKIIAKDTYFTAEEGREHGFLDDIVMLLHQVKPTMIAGGVSGISLSDLTLEQNQEESNLDELVDRLESTLEKLERLYPDFKDKLKK